MSFDETENPYKQIYDKIEHRTTVLEKLLYEIQNKQNLENQFQKGHRIQQ